MPTQRVQITDLFQGSSNQHPAKRRPGQVEDALNIRFDIGDGACRRNGTDLISDLPGLDPAEDYEHFQFLERFIISVSASGIVAHDMLREDGIDNAVPVQVIDATTGFGYLSTAESSSSFRVAALLNSLVILNRDVATAFQTSDDYTVQGEVLTYDRLFEEAEEGSSPTDAAIGHVWQVFEDWVETRAGYYQRGEEDGEPKWTLIPPPDDLNAVPDASTLPHRLVYDEDNDRFVFEVCPWRSRLSGTDATNPAPVWAGEKLKDIASHQGRLMLISQDYYTSGNIGAPRKSVFDLYDYNIDAPSDSDRIEIAITDATIGEPLHAISVGLDLVLLCDSGVSVFTAGDERLSAANGRDYKILDVPCSEVLPAVGAGEIFFADKTGLIHWILYSDGGIRHQGSINDHRRDLLNNKTLSGLWLSEQTLFLTTDQGVEGFSRYLIPQGNYQSAWGGYRFFEHAEAVFRVDDAAVVLTKNATHGYSLLHLYQRQPILADEADFEICLDRRERIYGAYEPQRDRTRFSHEGRDASTQSVIVLTQADGTLFVQPVSPQMIQGNRIYVQGDWSEESHWIGFSYESYFELSPLWAGASSIMPLLSGINIPHKGTTDYIVQIKAEGEDWEDSPWSASLVDGTAMGALLPDTGISQHLALGDARYTAIRIYSNSAGYFAIPAVEYRYRLKGKP